MQTTTVRSGRESAVMSSHRSQHQQDDNVMGPGSYEVGNSFGSTSKGFTIGVRRESRREGSPGPGEYEVGRSDSQTKTRVDNSVDF